MPWSPREPSLQTRILGEFRIRPVKALADEVLACFHAGIKRLNVVTSKWPEYQLENDEWLDVAETSSTISVFVYDAAKPTTYQLISLVEQGQKVLLPGVDDADFFQLVQALDLKSLSDVLLLDLMTTKAFSVCEKDMPPIRILTPDDALSKGIRLDLDLHSYQTERLSLWWERWGGILYSYEYDADEKKRVFTLLERSVGDFRPFPFWLRR